MADTQKRPFLGVLSDTFDKLTDVLNLGRILSIGVPGFVAAFGLMMLLSLVTTPFSISKPLPERQNPPQAAPAADQLDIPAALESINDVISGDAGNEPEPGREFAGRLFIDRAPTYRQRLRHDFTSVVRKWYIWFIAAIMMGSTIGVWTYSFLRDRENLHETWQELVQLVLGSLSEAWRTASDASARKPLDRICAEVLKRSYRWRGLQRKIAKAENLVSRPESGIDPSLPADLRVLRLEAARRASRTQGLRLSWTNLHLPLMTVDFSGVSLHDHLVKEYWRFVEFAANFPVALILCSLLFGLYFLLLGFFYQLPWWPFRVVWAGAFFAVGAACWLLFWFFWHPKVVHSAYCKYRVAGTGVIAGLMLFSPDQEGGRNRLEKLCEDSDYAKACADYCRRFREEFRIRKH